MSEEKTQSRKRRRGGTSSKRKTYSQKRDGGLKNQLIPRYNHVSNMRVGFPTSMTVKMRYSDTISINPGSGVLGSYVFRANDMYDPDYTGLGHQPLGFDQYMGVMYNHFTVLGSKITIQPVGGSSNQVAEVTCLLSDVNNISGLGMNDLREQPNAITQTICGWTGSLPKKMSINFSMKKFFRRGVEKELSGTSAAGPGEQAYYIIAANAIPTTDDAGPQYFRIVIDYIALLTEPRKLTES